MHTIDACDGSFKRIYEGKEGQEIMVRIWPGDKHESGVIFYNYQVVGIEHDNIHRAPGADPLDALYNAMTGVDILLQGYKKKEGNSLHWPNGLDENDLGLPPIF